MGIFMDVPTKFTSCPVVAPPTASYDSCSVAHSSIAQRADDFTTSQVATIIPCLAKVDLGLGG